jgi:hypothetical protein
VAELDRRAELPGAPIDPALPRVHLIAGQSEKTDHGLISLVRERRYRIKQAVSLLTHQAIVLLRANQTHRHIRLCRSLRRGGQHAMMMWLELRESVIK